MSTRALWTGPDANGSTWSLRSDQTVWSLGANGSWSQATSSTQILAVLWTAAGASGSALATTGFAIAACEGGPPLPPPPPQMP